MKFHFQFDIKKLDRSWVKRLRIEIRFSEYILECTFIWFQLKFRSLVVYSQNCTARSNSNSKRLFVLSSLPYSLHSFTCCCCWFFLESKMLHMYVCLESVVLKCESYEKDLSSWARIRFDLFCCWVAVVVTIIDIVIIKFACDSKRQIAPSSAHVKVDLV